MSDTGQDSEKRLHVHTDKGIELYETNRDSHIRKLAKSWKLVENTLKTDISFDDQTAISTKKQELSKHFDEFSGIFQEFNDFLLRTNSTESKADYDKHLENFNTKSQLVRDMFTTLDSSIKPQEDARSTSRLSHRSRSSGNSSMSTIIAKSKAKAEAARVSMEFALREAELKQKNALLAEEQTLDMARNTAFKERRKVELETDLNLLSHQKEIAVAEAQLRVLKDEDDRLDFDIADSYLKRDNVKTRDYIDPVERIQQYVKQQAEFTKADSKVRLPAYPPTTRVTQQNLDEPPNKLDFQKLNPNAPSFQPDRYGQSDQASQDKSEHSVVADFTRYLLKKDLLMSRLSSFNDKPESFCSWRASFTSIMTELKVNPSEELDLLVKYLGPESKSYAQSIRTANANNPEQGLKRLWERLQERYGSPELIEAALRHKIEKFPKITYRDHKRLYELSDILCEIEAVKEDPKFSRLLSSYDSSIGILPIIQKLPNDIQQKWTSQAAKYKKQHDVTFPPFTFFVQFIQEISRVKNDPGFVYDTHAQSSYVSKDKPQSKFVSASLNNNRSGVRSMKTDLETESTTVKDTDVCPLHKNSRHTLNQCRVFKSKSFDDRRKYLKDNNICFRCCVSSEHLARNCKEKLTCGDCGSNTHTTAMHIVQPLQSHGGEKTIDSSSTQSSSVNSKCTQICGNFNGKSCSKTVLVNVYSNDNVVKAYAILDDQSNRSLAAPELFDLLNVSSESSEYRLTSCAGTITTSGRRANGLTIESHDQNSRMTLPTLIECELPDIREEIPSPDVAKFHPHLQDLVDCIPPVDNKIPILLLIGRDLPEAHHIFEQITGPKNSPFAQKTNLGWVIVGETCLSQFHRPDTVSVNKTYLMRSGRMSICKPCPNNFEIKENISKDLRTTEQLDSEPESGIFVRTKDDDKVGFSIDDHEFLDIMDQNVLKNSDGSWEAPLPFKSSRPRLPNNRVQALKRAKSLDHSLRKDDVKRDHFVAFMQKMIDNKHAEVAPTLQDDSESWYLPIFGVYHPKKPTQIRIVFDSSAKFENISLNDVLLSGPDMNNSLLGVLLRFRRDLVGMTADIQQMFYCFIVSEKHRDYLRFFWYEDNDPSKKMIEYRMRVHVFGNSPSPSVATYCLRKTANIGEEPDDVTDFIDNNFYVDDGLISLPTAEAAITLMKSTQERLKTNGNLRLHKIASNDQDVMNAFSEEDIASHLKGIDIGANPEAIQRSLGLYWDLRTDTFTYHVSLAEKAFSRRGVLSVVNSLYDPMGFLAPVVIQGKLILRELMVGTKDWDEPLPEHMRDKWTRWRETLNSLHTVSIQRSYAPISWNSMEKREVFVYCDASEKAIASVAFMKSTDSLGNTHVGFIIGKAKVAPLHGHSIPRLELCAAVLAIRISEIISNELGISTDSFKFFTDSRIVLGYIHNVSKRFYMYVANRVARIRKSSKPGQWSHVSTNLNPADVATRPIKAEKLHESIWLRGSTHILQPFINETEYPLIEPEQDKEVRQTVQVLKSEIREDAFSLSRRCEKFSVWTDLVNALVLLRRFIRNIRKDKHSVPIASVSDYDQTERFIISTIQNEVFENEVSCIKNNIPLPRNSRIRNLNPYIDNEGLLRVGGRLSRSELDDKAKHPVIIPGNHHLAILLVRHYHSEVKHQGRHFTAGALRSAGYWIVGEKRLVSSILHKCVICRRLRGKQEQQLMSDLPSDRLTPGAPFSSVGIDVFGPWSVVTRKTRGGQANSKRWALLITCLTTRAIHIEVIEELTSSSFINALRRFVALRGSIDEIRSDRGTNFVGSVDCLDVDAINVEDGLVRKFLQEKRTVWKFNPPHSSHMGGIWERMIGITRRILESMMLEIQGKHLTHEVLTTFLAEVCAIVNGRPIVPISYDPESPEVLSPAMLLTQKTGSYPSPVGTFDAKDLYKAQWRRVQYLADTFWSRWNKEYLQTLQSRRKWTDTSPNLKQGDVVLIRDKQVCRNDWPLGVIERPLPSEDGNVRKAKVRIVRDGTSKTFTRPVSEMVVLIRD